MKKKEITKVKETPTKISIKPDKIKTDADTSNNIASIIYPKSGKGL